MSKPDGLGSNDLVFDRLDKIKTDLIVEFDKSLEGISQLEGAAKEIRSAGSKFLEKGEEVESRIAALDSMTTLGKGEIEHLENRLVLEMEKNRIALASALENSIAKFNQLVLSGDGSALTRTEFVREHLPVILNRIGLVGEIVEELNKVTYGAILKSFNERLMNLESELVEMKSMLKN